MTAADIQQDQDFVITRTFNARREKVWRAWSDTNQLAQWWGPKGCTIRVIKHDFRPGGLFHYSMQFQPGQEMWGRFIYGPISAPEHLEFINSFSDPQGGVTRAPFPQIGETWPLEVHNVMKLTEDGGKTVLTLRGGPINATSTEMKTYVSMFDSMRQGFGGSFDQLDAFLSKH